MFPAATIALVPGTDQGRASQVAAVVRDRGLRLASVAFALFRPAESAQWIAILVYVYRASGTTAMGLVAVGLLVPAAIAAPFLAQLGDRMPRGRALALGYGVQAVATGATAICLALAAPDLLIFLAAAIATVAITITRPVHLSMLPEIASSPAQLTAANALTSTVEGLSVFIGPLVAGVVLAVSGPAAVFAVASLALAVAALLVSFIEPRSREISIRHAGYEEAWEGFHQLRRQQGARLLLGFVAGQTAVIGALDVLTVVLALAVLSMGPSGPAVLSAAIGVGGLVGAAATIVLIGRERLSPVFLAGVLAVGVPLALVSVVPGAAVAFLLLGLSGVGRSFFDVTARTLLQRTVDDEVLARVFGIQEGLNMAALAVGAIVAPALVAAFTARGAFVLVGLMLPVAALIAFGRILSVDRHARVVSPADVALLRGTPIFAPLGPAQLERVAHRLIDVQTRAGAVVMRQGDVGDRFYLIAEGSVDVARNGSTIAQLGPGDFVGEIALLHDIPRTATVTTLTACRFRALERESFLAAVTGSPTSSVAAAAEAERRLARHDAADDHGA